MEVRQEPTTAARISTAAALAAIVAAAVALRAWRLGERSLWFDEAFSWRLASFPWGEMLRRTTLDNNPPFYYVVFKAWIGCAGDTAIAMRWLSVLAGAASCVGAFLMVDEAYREGGAIEPRRRRWMALFAAALVAVTTLQVRWGWEARMYALGAALAAFSIWLLLRALRAPLHRHEAPWRRWRDALPWLLYATVALAFAYTHTYAQFSLAAQAAFAAAHMFVEARCSPAAFFASRRFRLAALGFALIAMGWLPWLPVLLRQNAQVQRVYWTGPLTRWSVPNICHQIFAEPENRTTNNPAAAIAAAACALVLLALLWRPRAGDWLLLLSATVPLALAVAISACGSNILSVACFIFAQVFLLAALARLVGRIGRWPERTIVAAIVLGNLLLLHLDFVERLDIPHQSGLRAAAEHIAAHRRPGEPMIVCFPFFYLPLRYHLGDDPSCRLLHPGRPLVHYEGTAALAGGELIDPSELESLVGERVWVVGDLPAKPNGWTELSRKACYEGYGIPGPVVVLEYATGARKP
jgi:uncharacterized membrane protein